MERQWLSHVQEADTTSESQVLPGAGAAGGFAISPAESQGGRNNCFCLFNLKEELSDAHTAGHLFAFLASQCQQLSGTLAVD